MNSSIKYPFFAVLTAALLCALVVGVSRSWGEIPPLDYFLDAWHGVYRTARLAKEPSSIDDAHIPGLSAPTRAYRDDRNVPHIIAQSDTDAAMTLGYIVASERLFQMDFQMRVASGRLSEVFGRDRLETDRFLRRTGMALGAERSWKQIQERFPRERAVVEAFTRGVNAYIERLSPKDYPFEFRLLDYAPEKWTPLKSLLVSQLMAFDLTFQTQMSDVAMEEIRSQLGDEAFAELYPNHSVLNVPQSPEPQGVFPPRAAQTSAASPLSSTSLSSKILSPKSVSQAHSNKGNSRVPLEARALEAILQARRDAGAIYGEVAEGKGSNNWVVAGSKTRSGKPLLAGDPHLSLALPSIWYEAHIITPEMNIYGVTIPGAPLIIIGFNDFVAWSPTNTGADVVDFYAMQWENAERLRYLHNGKRQTPERRVETIRVKDGADVADTMILTHWGPIITVDNQSLALRWTAHEPSTILTALWEMNHARNLDDFTEAQKKWDTPAQNIAFADKDGNISLRSCGYYPIRQRGHGRGVHNGATDEGAWIGRIPFDSIPASQNPARGYLASANQEPTPADYPYYLNYDWGDVWRSRRIEQILSPAQNLEWKDMERFQTDVKVMQWEFLKKHILALNFTPAAAPQRRAFEALKNWNGVADTANSAALAFHLFIGELRRQTWDEMADSSGSLRGNPTDPMIYHLVENAPDSRWFDRAQTPERETAADILRASLRAALDSLIAGYGEREEDWKWGARHRLIIRHQTRSSALRALWRGPYPFPGFQATVLPAGGMTTTHSASWRMVVDFADGAPRGYGVFPGGLSGNPLSRHYDDYIPQWLSGALYPLQKPASEEECKKAGMKLRAAHAP